MLCVVQKKKWKLWEKTEELWIKHSDRDGNKLKVQSDREKSKKKSKIKKKKLYKKLTCTYL